VHIFITIVFECLAHSEYLACFRACVYVTDNRRSYVLFLTYVPEAVITGFATFFQFSKSFN